MTGPGLADIDWSAIRTVLLDMDGTLLDLHFDSYLWHQHLPVRYAEKHGLTLAAAQDYLVLRIRAEEGTLNWYCLDYWSRELGLDIAALEHEVAHKIAVHPHVEAFLARARARGCKLVLTTNAHRRSLALKLARTGIGIWFDRLVSAHDFGVPKEDPAFWSRLMGVEHFHPEATLLIDDNPRVLRSARAFGIRFLLAVTRPDSQAPGRDHPGFAQVDHFGELLAAPCMQSI